MELIKSVVIVAGLMARFVLGDICTSNICEYSFTIRHQETMVYRGQGKTVNVRLNGTDLLTTANQMRLNDVTMGAKVNNSDVITADGFERLVITINGQFPGPTIEVLEGAQVRNSNYYAQSER